MCTYQKIVLFLIASFVSLHLFSCTAQNITVAQSGCEPTHVECQPTIYSGSGIDTSLLYPGNYVYSLVELPEPYNSNRNEYAVTFHRSAVYVSTDRDRSYDVYPQVIYRVSGTADKVVETDSLIVFGTPVFSQSEGKLYFSAKARNDEPGDYDIFIAEYDEKSNSLQNVKLLPGISRLHTFESQPALSPDGKTLYFVSDRPGGYGGVDIWSSTRSSLGANWSEPSPSSTINTPCDELFPVFSHNGSFFFSSNGHQSIGGYDVFRATIMNGFFSDVKNVGKPINSNSDELSSSVPNDSLLYFTSNRPGKHHGFNIFSFRRVQLSPKQAELYASRKSNSPPDVSELFERLDVSTSTTLDSSPITVQGKVRSARDTAIVPSDATVFWRDVKTEVELGRKKTNSDGEYSISLPRGKEYDLGAETREQFYDIKRLDLRNVEGNSINAPTLNIPDTLLLRINFPFNDDSNPYDFVINDDGTQSERKWKVLLDILASSINSYKSELKEVLVIGHTDYFGTNAFNKKLATRRADFVISELIKRGVPKHILRILSKGEEVPIQRREGEDDELYRMRLRRVEFVKVFKRAK